MVNGSDLTFFHLSLSLSFFRDFAWAGVALQASTRAVPGKRAAAAARQESTAPPRPLRAPIAPRASTRAVQGKVPARAAPLGSIPRVEILAAPCAPR